MEIQLRGQPKAEHAGHVLHGLRVLAACLGLEAVHLLGDALLADGTELAHVDDRLWKVLLAKTLLHELVAVWNEHSRTHL